MNPKTIRKLIEIVQETGIDVLEVRSWWRKVKITRKHPSLNGSAVYGAPYIAHPAELGESQITVNSPSVSGEAVGAKSSQAVRVSTEAEITSPMVGTFYSAPSPDAQAFLKVGDTVSVGAVVCIVEAMKLMNEIESEVSGVVTKVLVDNAQPVEFGQPLFLIDTGA